MIKAAFGAKTPGHVNKSLGSEKKYFKRMKMDALGITELIVIVVTVAIFIIPFWQICAKAGFSPWLSLLLFVPVINLLLLYYLAFANWPILDRKG